MLSRLSKREHDIYRVFQTVDLVFIDELFSLMYPNVKQPDPKRRHMYVGARISRVNEKIRDTGYRIVPGEVKRTYTLKKIDAAAS